MGRSAKAATKSKQSKAKTSEKNLEKSVSSMSLEDTAEQQLQAHVARTCGGIISHI